MSVEATNLPNTSISNTADNTSVSNTSGKIDDGGTSSNFIGRDVTVEDVKNLGSNSDDIFTGAFHSAGLFKRSEIDLFNRRYRFGISDPYNSLSTCREYLFFTKPDLNIYPRDDTTGIPNSSLNEYLQSQPYWTELARKNLNVIKCLQNSISPKDPFNNLLANMVQSNLDIPVLSSDMIDTPTNMYGVGYGYRGSSEASDNGYDFSLEFRDTKFLPVYNFFKAYEDYETIKHHGSIRPWLQYIINKVVHDQYSIFKFMVDEDGETIIHYSVFYGVKSKSLPRDAFSTPVFDSGLSYSIDFNAAFFDDSKPYILMDFNNLSREYYNSMPYQIDVHNEILDRVDNRPAKAAYIVEADSMVAPGGKVYKLKWRGDDKI